MEENDEGIIALVSRIGVPIAMFDESIIAATRILIAVDQ